MAFIIRHVTVSDRYLGPIERGFAWSHNGGKPPVFATLEGARAAIATRSTQPFQVWKILEVKYAFRWFTVGGIALECEKTEQYCGLGNDGTLCHFTDRKGAARFGTRELALKTMLAAHDGDEYVLCGRGAGDTAKKIGWKPVRFVKEVK